MTNLNTVSEAINLFEQYFPAGLNYNSGLDQITKPRIRPIGETNSMRLGEQLQFLGALHNQVPSTNTARQGRIETEITKVLSILDLEGYLNVTNSENNNYLNESFALMGLSIIKAGTAYPKLSGPSKQIVDNGLTNLVAFAKNKLTVEYSNGGTWGNRVPTVYTEYQTGTKIKVPLMSLNSTSILIGALGMYENLIAKSQGSSDLIIKFCDALLGFENQVNNGGYYTIGGGVVAPRRLFGSAGYNSVVGQALFLGYKGLAQKPFTDTPVSTNKYQGAGERIAKFYETIIDNRGIRLDEFHNSQGIPVTKAMLDAAMSAADSSNFKADPDSTKAQARYNEATALINTPAHAQSSAYLYSLAWGAPIAFLQKLDKLVVQTGEANPNLAGVSAMRAVVNAPNKENSRIAATGRILTGFAALMMRGVATITDGH
ncbi:hypothetical protein [Lysinibacillus piscis]|uniref:Uncharacterized protein n=1 Tax=Lysinibacillus piscis TaxID=2518931 RepID=A0ABQ5NIP3_9BACI|nr:hypothetical protein [Lysinibacillus sp. KH24]GLC88241.1 hypothetical protein LYSBPC_13680 [Lysinibacillus sp. KH24]